MEKWTTAQIKTLLSKVSQSDDVVLTQLRQDSRKSVQTLIAQTEKRLAKQAQQRAAHLERLDYEHQLIQRGFTAIAGVDEVGRGPLAGPVVVAAVILPQDCRELLVGVNDSKQLSHQKRLAYAQQIREVALAIEIVEVAPAEIDRLNIYQATRQAMGQAVAQLSIPADYLLVDAMTLETSIEQLSLIKGDQKSLSIAAASIIAKVYRDQLMTDYASIYPEFHFERNMGYGTADHITALQQYGYTLIHRRSFEPVKSMTKRYQA